MGVVEQLGGSCFAIKKHGSLLRFEKLAVEMRQGISDSFSRALRMAWSNELWMLLRRGTVLGSLGRLQGSMSIRA